MLRALLWQSTLVALAGAAVGLAANALGPRPVALGTPIHAHAEEVACGSAPRIQVEEAVRLCDGCHAAFVDARDAAAYAAGHVSGALHLPAPAHPGRAAVLAQLRAAPLVIVYDADASCTRADEVAARLQAEGLPDVRVLSGAWPGWEAARGPGASGGCVECGDDAGGRP